MKAAIVEKANHLVVREIDEPIIGDYDALCEMLFGAVCTGTDHHLLRDKFPWGVSYPTILGHESIGRVTQVGARVRYLKIGDIVTRVGAPAQENLHAHWGGFVEVGVAKDHRAMQEDGLPQSEWQSFTINQIVPQDISPDAATMIITWRETLSYISRLGVRAGQRVLILGSGGNGLAFVAHAANAGAEVIVSGSAVREETARALGATQFYDYKNSKIEDIAAIHADGFDIIIDALGKIGQMDSALPLLAAGGTIGIYGVDDYNSVTINPHRARGTFTFFNGGQDEAETHERVIKLMREGKLDARHWLGLDSPFALDDIQSAFTALAQRKLVKAVIRLSRD